MCGGTATNGLAEYMDQGPLIQIPLDRKPFASQRLLEPGLPTRTRETLHVEQIKKHLAVGMADAEVGEVIWGFANKANFQWAVTHEEGAKAPCHSAQALQRLFNEKPAKFIHLYGAPVQYAWCMVGKRVPGDSPRQIDHQDCANTAI